MTLALDFQVDRMVAVPTYDQGQPDSSRIIFHLTSRHRLIFLMAWRLNPIPFFSGSLPFFKGAVHFFPTMAAPQSFSLRSHLLSPRNVRSGTY